MPGFLNVPVITAVIALVIVRQCAPQRVSGDRRWWVLPGVLLVMALREPGLVDPRHQAQSVGVLGAEVAVGVITGAGWAWTTRLWPAEDGALWGKGTRATVCVRTGGLTLRAALYGLAAVRGIHQGVPALMTALAATPVVRGGVLAWRAAEIPQPCRAPAEATPPRPAWKDRV
ncbi:DUF1453 domain-containing protein [Streptomyces sp. NPDC005426]|uniref:DUF1453 domain-containing protein n=1 Tax=Streptomyces sp. NPDC005426 TaxID=3155344 RepID=UPI0033A07670